MQADSSGVSECRDFQEGLLNVAVGGIDTVAAD